MDSRQQIAHLQEGISRSIIGQEHIVGPGRLLRRAIQADQLGSLIFYGPPGTGKTMAAEIMANELALDLYKIDLSTVQPNSILATGTIPLRLKILPITGDVAWIFPVDMDAALSGS